MFLDEVPADFIIARLLRYRWWERVVGGEGDPFAVDEDKVSPFRLDILSSHHMVSIHAKTQLRQRCILTGKPNSSKTPQK